MGAPFLPAFGRSGDFDFEVALDFAARRHLTPTKLQDEFTRCQPQSGERMQPMAQAMGEVFDLVRPVSLHIRAQDGVDTRLVSALAPEPSQQTRIQAHGRVENSFCRSTTMRDL